MEQAQKTLGRKVGAIEPKEPMPQSLAYVYGWWCEMFSGESLTYVEIDAWGRVTGTYPLPEEARLLKSIDRAYWKVRNANSKT